jgi:hypothetical protein
MKLLNAILRPFKWLGDKLLGRIKTSAKPQPVLPASTIRVPFDGYSSVGGGGGSGFTATTITHRGQRYVDHMPDHLVANAKPAQLVNNTPKRPVPASKKPATKTKSSKPTAAPAKRRPTKKK